MSEQDRQLTVMEVTNRLRLSTASIYSLVSSGTLLAVPVGNGRGSIRFRDEDIKSYLGACVTKHRTDSPRPIRQPKYDFKHLKLGMGVRS